MDEDTLLFFAGRPEALALYEILKQQILSRITNVKIKIAKTQITFANPKGFAFVSFLPVRRAKQRPPCLPDGNLRPGLLEGICPD